MKILIRFLVLMFLVETQACAYSDPGSGALVWQMLMAGFFGAVFYARKVVSFFKGRK